MQTHLEGSTRPSATTTPVSRRGFLHILGLGSGVVAVATATGLTWRSVDGGVFATGTGPAYEAWDRAAPSGTERHRAAPSGNAISLVSAAILAANAHNTQPCLFTVADDRIDLFADMTRTIGAMDPLLRELYLSLGGAIENLVLAAPPNGFTPAVSLLPDPTHIATVALSATSAAGSLLFDAITERHTSRGSYDTTQSVDSPQLGALGDLADKPDVRVVWFTTDADKRTFSDLTVRATEAIIADEDQASDDYRWYRSDWDDLQRHKDGITIDPSGSPSSSGRFPS